MPSRRLMLTGSAGIVGAMVAPSSSRPDGRRPTRDVRDFGAKGDGITDDTEAFNRATQADAEWSEDLVSSIRVPAGRYKLSGSVFLRKGQSLIGEGLSTHIDATGATRSVFILGQRRGAGRGVADPGGLPVRVESFFGLGGPGDKGFIYANLPGFQIAGLFLSAVGVGIEVEGADGIISGVAVDQCLTAVLIRNSQNLVLSDLNVYLPNYGVILAGDCRDIVLSNSLFCYTKYVSVLLGDGARNINGVVVANCVFTNNSSFATFEAFIYSRASQSDLLVTGCSFRNPPRYAIAQGAGTDLSLVVSGCVIDGRRSNGLYDQSADPRGISAGAGHFTVSNCVFRNLSEAVCVAAVTASLQLDGGTVEQHVGRSIAIEGEVAGVIAVKEVSGLARWVEADPGHHRVDLPWLGARMRCELALTPRGADATVLAARFLVLGVGSGVTVQTLWSAGQTPNVAVAIAGAGRSQRVQLLLDARQFGAMTPAIETVIHA